VYYKQELRPRNCPNYICSHTKSRGDTRWPFFPISQLSWNFIWIV